MEATEIKDLITPVIDGVKSLQTTIDAVKEAQVILDTDMKAAKEWRITKDEADKKNQAAIDKMIKEGTAVYINGARESADFGTQLHKALAENYKGISQVRKGNGFSFELIVSRMDDLRGKDMSLATNVTPAGQGVHSYLDFAPLPKAPLNFRDLCSMVNTATGLITLPRETTPTGSVSRVTDTQTKPQIDYNISMVDFKADYIAGFVRIKKTMLQDLPFLQTWLPRLLLRDFYKAENLQFYTDLTAVASGSTTTGNTVYAAKVIDWIANLGNAGYTANAAVGTYSEWASLLTTQASASAGYGMPGASSIDANGVVRVAGVPYYPATWVAAGKTIVADWNYISIAVADALKVEFFEQDVDNVIKNNITVRVEAREVLVVEQPGAAVFA